MFAVDDEESEMISLYGLSTFDLAPAHAEVPELWEVVVGGLWGPGGGPLRPGGSGGRGSVPMAVAMVTLSEMLFRAYQISHVVESSPISQKRRVVWLLDCRVGHPA